LLIAGALFVGAAGGYWYGRHHGDEAESESSATRPAEEDKPVAEVTVAPLKRGPISETIVAYGSVTAQAGEVRAVSVPFESRVARVLVTPGQRVMAGAAIIEVEASPDAKVALQEAKNALAGAKVDAQRAEQRFA